MSNKDKINKLLEQLPEKIRAKVLTYPESEWKYCIEALNALPDVLADEDIVDFCQTEKIEDRDKENSTFGVLVLTATRIIFAGANKFVSTKEYMAFTFAQIRIATCTSYSLTIYVANLRITFNNINTPLKYMEIINQHLQMAQANSANDFMRDLRELADLKCKGLLTEEEFTLAKKKLLQ